jgi:hypothetical protein
VSYAWYSAINRALTKFRYNILKIKNESSFSVKETMKCTMNVSLHGPSLSYCVRDFIRVRISRKETDGVLFEISFSAFSTKHCLFSSYLMNRFTFDYDRCIGNGVVLIMLSRLCLDP